ncbi:glycosyltransferase family 9 protein [Dyella silvae]|uniref:glycosyltransferase family 9 protein n=1 Tax=Dyella silvae TaxID=2994424 RepID=UPI002264EEAE|nr:glycosyltransferase family 9 protein [Dyella silvae]
MLLITPLITELERLYKGAEIDIIAEGDIGKEVFSTFFSVKNIYCLPKRGFKHPWSFLRLLSKVRKTRYDLIVDPCIGSGFSRALTRALNGTYKLGFDDKWAGSGLTHAVPEDAALRHMAHRPVNLVRWVPSPEHVDDQQYPMLDIRLTDVELAQGRQVIHELLDVPTETSMPLVVGIFGNATRAKRYPSEWWREFLDTFRAQCPQARLIEVVPMHGHSMFGAEWPGYYSTDIRRMGAVMAGMDLMITADCGVMHLAVASKVPTVGMFSVTDATVYEPYGMGSCALVTKGLTAQEVASRIVANYAQLLEHKAPAGVPWQNPPTLEQQVRM